MTRLIFRADTGRARTTFAASPYRPARRKYNISMALIH